MSSVDINGVSTYYEEYGDRPPLVVLHGANSEHQLWAEQLQPLTDSFSVIAYDLREHGQSDGSTHESYTMDRYADDLATMLDLVRDLSANDGLTSLRERRRPVGLLLDATGIVAVGHSFDFRSQYC